MDGLFGALVVWGGVGWVHSDWTWVWCDGGVCVHMVVVCVMDNVTWTQEETERKIKHKKGHKRQK